MIHLLPKKKVTASKGENVLFYSSLLFLIISILAYIVFTVLNNKLSNQIQNVKASIAQTNNKAEIQLEQKAKDYEEKLKSFSFILDKHIYPSKSFSIIENDTLPNVYFTTFDLNSSDLSISLDGATDDFRSLGRQILIFQKDPLIKSVSLTSISVASLGMVNFGLNILLQPQSIMIQK